MIALQTPSVRGFQQSSKSGSGNTRLNLPNPSVRSKQSAKALTDQLTTKKRDSVTNSNLHIHGDYLRLIGKGIDETVFNELLKSVGNGKDFAHYSDGSYTLGKGCPRYENMAINTDYVKVLYTAEKNQDADDILYRYTLDITGTTLEQWDTVYIWRLCLQLSHEKYNGHWSRFDIAIDDYNQQFNLISHCMDAIKKGQNIGFKKNRDFTDRDGSVEIGKTLYLGTRESKRFTRIYTAKEKHGIDATRFETELRGKYAQQTVKEFINEGLSKRDCMDATESMNDEQLNQHLSTWLGKVAIGHIGFKDKTKQRVNGQVSDLPDVPFWAWFKKRVGGTHKIVVAAVKTTIEKTKSWLEKQCSKPLARLKVAMGVKGFRAWFDSSVASGFSRLDRFDELLIQDYRELNPVMF